MTLQNHLGDTEFPVRARGRYATQNDVARRQDQKAIGRRALLLAGIAAPFGLAGLAVALILYPDGTELANPFISFALGLVIGIIVAGLMLRWRDAGAPRRAQQAYLALADRDAPTLAQQQILALDASSDFSFRGWNSSLGFVPTWIELPDRVRQRHRDGRDGSPWPALPMESIEKFRTALDDQFRIASATDAEVLVADTLARGMLSQQFAEVADGEHAERMVSRVAALSGRPYFDVLELGQSADGRPPTLLLAGDVERTIGAIRYAYVAGYLGADEAWRLLEPVAARAFTRYESYTQYWEDVLVATAFRTDSLDAVQQQRANLEALRASAWPAASTAFPTR